MTRIETLHPSAWTALLRPDSEVDEHRNLFCDHYDDCLDEAVGRGWVSWSCAQCALFAPRPHPLDARGRAPALAHASPG